MKDGPVIASVAALLGDPARANMLTALMDGRSLTVSELARAAGVAMPTSSGHLARMERAGLVTVTRQGRHRYYRLSGPDVGEVLEALMGLAQRTGAVRVRTGPRDAALREARICYDHLAGERGVELLDLIRARGLIAGDDDPALTDEGRDFFVEYGLDLAVIQASRRRTCRICLDWSERRSHLGGALGAALLESFLARKWLQRREGRALAFTPSGRSGFDAVFGGAGSKSAIFPPRRASSTG